LKRRVHVPVLLGQERKGESACLYLFQARLQSSRSSRCATGAQSDCAKIAVLERIVSHKLAVASAGPVSRLRKKAWLAAKVIEEPENQADRDADDQARG
jgi:hypothetical protein